jgi:GntR family histidine utilization transcriptional repressor
MTALEPLKTSEAGALPRYREIYDTLRQKIVSGAWPAGHKLPSEHELARSFGCARMTVGKALGALAEQRLVTRRRRAGTTVSAPRPQESVLEIHDIEAELVAAGSRYDYQCLHRQVRPANPDDASALGVTAGTPVLSLIGLHRADGRPHALEERLINLRAVPEARRARFARTSPGRWLLQRIPWTDAEHQICALNAGAAIARHLEIARHKACLCIERNTWLDAQRVTHVRLIYPCDQHRLIARFRHKRA